MILARIDERRMLELVRTAPLIAFQRRKYGYAIAAPLEAYYAPVSHPGDGNLVQDQDESFMQALGSAFLERMEKPTARTLRPTAQPIMTLGLWRYLDTAFGATPEPMEHYAKAAGDHQEVMDYECQVVLQAISEHGRPDLKDAISHVKIDFMDECCNQAIEALSIVVRGLATQPYSPLHTRLYLTQAANALKNALGMLLEP